MNFGVVANVYREAAVKEKAFNTGGFGEFFGNLAQFGSEILADFRRKRPCFLERFDYKSGADVLALVLQADQGGAEDKRVAVKRFFATISVESFFWAGHPFSLASAEPKLPEFIEVAEISHAVPEEAVGVDAFGGQSSFGAVVVSGGDDWSTGDDFADAVVGEGFRFGVKGCLWLIGNGQDFHAHGRQRASQAGALSGGGGDIALQDFGTADGG